MDSYIETINDPTKPQAGEKPLTLQELSYCEIAGRRIKQLLCESGAIFDKSVWQNGFVLGKIPDAENTGIRSDLTASSLPIKLAGEDGNDGTLRDVEMCIKPDKEGNFIVYNTTSEPMTIWDNSTGKSQQIPPGQSGSVDSRGFRTYVGTDNRQAINFTGNKLDGSAEENKVSITFIKVDKDRPLTENDFWHWRNKKGDPLKGGI